MIIARVGDIVVGTCVCANPPYPDIGIISVGDPMHLDVAPATARIGDTVIFSCGSSVITTGSATDFSTSSMVARATDMVSGCGIGTITTTSVHISM